MTLAIVYEGVAFPLMISMLDKRGNSNTNERIELINRYIALFGLESIDILTADREFIGKDWICFLNSLRIKYCIRIRENFNVSRHGKSVKASYLFCNLKYGEAQALTQVYSVNGQHCYISASRMKNRDGKPDLQIIISFNFKSDAHEIYRERWQIETAFKAMKTGGFNSEDTHLSDTERIGKLFSIVMLAFAWAYVVGIYVDANIRKIKIKKHGYREKSFFKCGLETVANVLLNPFYNPGFNIFKFLSCS